jgi:hypothetical protein
MNVPQLTLPNNDENKEEEWGAGTKRKSNSNKKGGMIKLEEARKASEKRNLERRKDNLINTIKRVKSDYNTNYNKLIGERDDKKIQKIQGKLDSLNDYLKQLKKELDSVKTSLRDSDDDDSSSSDIDNPNIPSFMKDGTGTKRKYSPPRTPNMLTEQQGTTLLYILQDNNSHTSDRRTRLREAITNIGGGLESVERRFRRWMSGFNHPTQLENYMRIYQGILHYTPTPRNSPTSVARYFEEEDEGGAIKKKSNSNTKMPNAWITYVKEYAKKHNLKYNEALKDPKMKAGYKKGGSSLDPDNQIGGIGMKNTHTKGGSAYDDKIDKLRAENIIRNYGKRITGNGIPTSREEYIAQLYDQANLGANGRVNLN